MKLKVNIMMYVMKKKKRPKVMVPVNSVVSECSPAQYRGFFFLGLTCKYYFCEGLKVFEIVSNII